MKNKILLDLCNFIITILISTMPWSCFLANNDDNDQPKKEYSVWACITLAVNPKYTDNQVLLYLYGCLKDNGFLFLPNKNTNENKENDELEKPK